MDDVPTVANGRNPLQNRVTIQIDRQQSVKFNFIRRNPLQNRVTIQILFVRVWNARTEVAIPFKTGSLFKSLSEFLTF